MSRTKQFLYLFFGGGVVQVSHFFVAVILARRLSQEGYGTYSQVILVAQMIIPIFSVAIPNSFLFFIPRLGNDDEKRGFVRRTLFMLFFLGIAASLVMLAGAPLIAARFHNPDLLANLRLGCLYPTCTLLSSYFVPLMVSLGRAKQSAVYSASTSIIFLALATAASFVFNTVEAQVLFLSLSSLMFLVLAFAMTSRHLTLFRKRHMTSVSLRAQLSYALPLALGAIISIWGLKVDKAIVSSFFPADSFAIYSVGAMELPLIGLIGSSVFSVLLPAISQMMAREDKSAALSLWKRTIEKSMTIILPIFGLAVLCSHLIISILFSKKYVPSVIIFQIYLLLIPIRSINWGLLLKSIGKTKYDLFGSVIFLLCEVGLSIGFMQVFGLEGPAVGTVAAVYLLAMYYSFNIRGELGFRIVDILGLKNLSPMLCVTLIPIGIVWLVRSSLVFDQLPELFVYVFMYISIWIIFLWKTNRFRYVKELTAAFQGRSQYR